MGHERFSFEDALGFIEKALPGGDHLGSHCHSRDHALLGGIRDPFVVVVSLRLNRLPGFSAQGEHLFKVRE